ncbi:54S ribosomal protein L32, mitochondrial, variant 2 [Schistosoma haematobium]|uniref:54S ribosomal protein L32, mitochondrial, variant 2 n=1 Tax=Schistosoma haematobium TaxID=6185 RepID=A0A922S154_SCHHA|nr:54S ribosomal protein L32, mitochondrial, variant 2 [Schistosoma haematobium]KAH9588579.1 54S ribosomal protein L32, mitochondrial, variant 2 [Schistosoma haematobium]
MAQIYHALKSIILDFFGRVKPFDLAADTAALYHSSFFGSLKLWEDSIYFAVPKKRRTAEERRMRKFLSCRFPLSFYMTFVVRSGDYKPRDDLTPCKFCGYLNPRNFLCTNCYSKVREETNFLRSLVNGQLPSDHEVKFIYNDDNSTNASVSNAEVKVPGSRPSWFPSTLQETKSPGGENS